MTLYRRLIDGDAPAEWKWLYCAACQMEWLVPAVSPDAMPKFCCHCRGEIDPTVQPGDVLPDVTSEELEPAESYDACPTAEHAITIAVQATASVRVHPSVEIIEIDDDEVHAVQQSITLLVDDGLVVSIRMSHATLGLLASFLEDYVSTCGDLLINGQSLVGAPELIRFNSFNAIGDDHDDDNQ